MDGVLANFEAELHFRFPLLKAMPSGQEKNDKIDFLILNKARDIFDYLIPMPFAVEAFNTLCDHYDVHIVSTAMWDLPESFIAKRKWVEKWLGPKAKKKLTLTHYKGFFEGDYLIDDRIKNGVAEFKGEHIHFGTEKFPDWPTVLTYLQKKDAWRFKVTCENASLAEACE